MPLDFAGVIHRRTPALAFRMDTPYSHERTAARRPRPRVRSALVWGVARTECRAPDRVEDRIDARRGLRIAEIGRAVFDERFVRPKIAPEALPLIPECKHLKSMTPEAPVKEDACWLQVCAGWPAPVGAISNPERRTSSCDRTPTGKQGEMLPQLAYRHVERFHRAIRPRKHDAALHHRQNKDGKGVTIHAFC